MVKFVNKFRLFNAEGSIITDLSLTSGNAVFSQGIDVRKQEGFMSLLVKENKSGGGGDVDISAEYSLDKDNWYTAYTSDMSGVISAEGNIVTALQNVTRWMIFSARQAHFIRFKFDPDADSQITADFLFQEDNR